LFVIYLTTPSGIRTVFEWLWKFVGEQWTDKNVEGRGRDPVLTCYTGGTGKSQKYLSDGSRGLNRCLSKPEALPRKPAL